jgi:hypothetical protein
VWEKENNHRLFNFSEGFKDNEESKDLVGSYVISAGV